MARKICNKLVRDRVVQQLQARGISITYRFAPITELDVLINQKFEEECKEVREAILRLPHESTYEQLMEEFADLAEVLRAWASYYGIPWSHVEACRRKKMRHKGGFKRG